MEFNSYFSVNNEDMPQDLLKSMKKNSSDTAFVASKDDPRLKKYQDSLKLYNYTINEELKNFYGPNVSGKEAYNYITDPSSMTNQTIKKTAKKQFPKFFKYATKKEIEPIELRSMINVNDENPLSYGAATILYPKPKQPVKYQKPEPPKVEVKQTKGSKKYFINEIEVDEPTFNKIAPIKSMKKNEE